MNDCVIYTCIAGGYDGLEQPMVVYEGWDYICFVDRVTQPQVGVWKMREIPYASSDNTRRARYVKHNPHIVIPEYRYSVWIDSNVQIVDDLLLKRVGLLIAQGSVMAHIKHPSRDCIYDEARVCFRDARDGFLSIYKMVRHLKREGYPAHFGLSETNVIYREHSVAEVKEVSNMWWSFIRDYSKRDQLSFYYVLWRCKISVDMLLPEGVSTFSEEHFIRHTHNLTAKKKLCWSVALKVNMVMDKLFGWLLSPKK